jgi:hypothetical protein
VIRSRLLSKKKESSSGSKMLVRSIYPILSLRLKSEYIVSRPPLSSILVVNLLELLDHSTLRNRICRIHCIDACFYMF